MRVSIDQQLLKELVLTLLSVWRETTPVCRECGYNTIKHGHHKDCIFVRVCKDANAKLTAFPAVYEDGFYIEEQ